MNKPSVLFVDDEPNILHGLKRFTRSKRAEWNLMFASGGEEASEIVRTQNIDVLVTDMRMPGLDGADLLQRVSEMSPGTIRIILSGEADIQQAYRTIGKSHRFLAKPCDPVVIVTMIEQMLEHRDTAGHAMSLESGSFFDRLVVRGETVAALRRVFAQADVDPQAVAAIIARDASLAARLLQIVNSAYFGRPVSTCSIRRAVETLGLERIADLMEHDRFGPATSPTAGSAPATEGTCRPEALAEMARSKLAARNGSAGEQDMAYALGLFCSLGYGGEEQFKASTERHCFADKSAVFASALMGLPAQLTEHMHALTQMRPDTISMENCAEAICETLLIQSRQVA